MVLVGGGVIFQVFIYVRVIVAVHGAVLLEDVDVDEQLLRAVIGSRKLNRAVDGYGGCGSAQHGTAQQRAVAHGHVRYRGTVRISVRAGNRVDAVVAGISDLRHQIGAGFVAINAAQALVVAVDLYAVAARVLHRADGDIHRLAGGYGFRHPHGGISKQRRLGDGDGSRLAQACPHAVHKRAGAHLQEPAAPIGRYVECAGARSVDGGVFPVHGHGAVTVAVLVQSLHIEDEFGGAAHRSLGGNLLGGRRGGRAQSHRRTGGAAARHVDILAVVAVHPARLAVGADVDAVSAGNVKLSVGNGIAVLQRLAGHRLLGDIFAVRVVQRYGIILGVGIRV